MTTGFTVIVDDTEVRGVLGLVKQRLGNLRPLNAAIAEALAQSTKQRILDGVSPAGTPWEPLAESTRRMKRGPGILRESEELYASILPSWDDVSSGISSDRLYGLFQQEGTKPYVIRAKNGQALRLPGLGESGLLRRQVNHPGLPARPFFGVSAEDRQEILALGNDYLTLPGLGRGQ